MTTITVQCIDDQPREVDVLAEAGPFVVHHELLFDGPSARYVFTHVESGLMIHAGTLRNGRYLVWPDQDWCLEDARALAGMIQDGDIWQDEDGTWRYNDDLLARWQAYLRQ